MINLGEVLNLDQSCECKTSRFGSWGGWGGFSGFVGFLVETFGELVQWFYTGSSVDEDGFTYSFQGDNIRPLVNNWGLMEGNDSFHGVIASMPGIQWDHFKLRTIAQTFSVGATSNTYYFDSRSNGMNGYAVRLNDSNAGRPDSIQIIASDGAGLKKNYFYPAITTGERLEIDIVTVGTETTFTVLYDGSPKSPQFIALDGTLNPFTPNSSNVYVGRYHFDNTQGEFLSQLSDIEIGNAGGYFSWYSIQESAGQYSFDIHRNSTPIVWTGLNWQIPAIPSSAVNNTKGYNLYWRFDGAADSISHGVTTEIATGNSFETIHMHWEGAAEDLSDFPAMCAQYSGAGPLRSFEFQIEGAGALRAIVSPDGSTTEVVSTDDGFVSINTFYVVDIYVYLGDRVDFFLNDNLIDSISISTESLLIGSFDLKWGEQATGFNDFQGIMCENSYIENITNGARLDIRDGTPVNNTFGFYVPASNKSIDAVGASLANKSAKYPMKVNTSIPFGNGTDIAAEATVNITAWDNVMFACKYTNPVLMGYTKRLMDTRDINFENGYGISIFADDHPTYPGQFEVNIADGDAKEKQWIYPVPPVNTDFIMTFDGTDIRVWYDSVEQTPTDKPIDDVVDPFTPSPILHIGKTPNDVQYFTGAITDIRVGSIESLTHRFRCENGAGRVSLDEFYADTGAVMVWDETPDWTANPYAGHRNSRFMFGNAFGFDNANDYVEYGTDYGIYGTSIRIFRATVFLHSLQTYDAVMSQLGGIGNRMWNMRLTAGGQIELVISTNGSTVMTGTSSGGAVTTGSIQRIEAIWTPGVSVAFYVNDALINVDTTGIAPNMFNSNEPLRIGSQAGSNVVDGIVYASECEVLAEHNVVLWSRRDREYSLFNGVSQIPIETNENNPSVDVFGRIHGRRPDQANDPNAKFDWNIEGVPELDNAPNGYAIGDSLAGVDFADKRTYYDSEDHYMFAQTDNYQNQPGYNKYMADVP